MAKRSQPCGVASSIGVKAKVLNRIEPPLPVTSTESPVSSGGAVKRQRPVPTAPDRKRNSAETVSATS